MTDACQQTAYYLNGKLRCLALIARGVPFPGGTWIWVGSDLLTPEHAEELVRDLFPTLERATIRYATLLTEHDVREFERSPMKARSPKATAVRRR